jgi:hypothetical protein
VDCVIEHKKEKFLRLTPLPLITSSSKPPFLFQTVPIKYSTYHIYGDARKAREVAPELMLGVELVNGLRGATMPVIKSAHFSTPWTYLPKKQ